jgi:hypothetical protein
MTTDLYMGKNDLSIFLCLQPVIEHNRFCRTEKTRILKRGIGKLSPWSARIKDGIEFMECIIVGSYKNREVNVGSACIKRGDVRRALSNLPGMYFLPYI